MIGDIAHELAHMELEYDVDIEIYLNRELINQAKANKSNPNYFVDKNFNKLSCNEYLTDALVLGRGLGYELSSAWKAMRRYYGGKLSSKVIPPEDIDVFLDTPKKDLLPYKVRSKGEKPNINGFAVSGGYCGDFKNGKHHGIGKELHSDSIFIGEFKDGELHKGTHIFIDNASQINTFYIGEYKNRKRHGYGRFYYASDRVYDGEWKNDLKDGHGILYNADGSVAYDGEWKNDNYTV